MVCKFWYATCLILSQVITMIYGTQITLKSNKVLQLTLQGNLPWTCMLPSNFSKIFSWFRHKLSFLYFVWRKQILQDSSMQHAKFKCTCCKPIIQDFVQIMENFPCIFYKMRAIKFFVIVINYSFHLFYHCKPRNAWYWPYVCNLIKIRNLNTLFLTEKQKKLQKGMLDCKN